MSKMYTLKNFEKEKYNFRSSDIIFNRSPKLFQLSLTRCPVDCLNWHPRFVSVDFMRIQNERSKPLYLLFDWTDIDEDTECLNKKCILTLDQ